MLKIKDLLISNLKNSSYILVVSTDYNVHIHLAFEGLGDIEDNLIFAFPHEIENTPKILTKALACIIVRDLYFTCLYKVAYEASVNSIPLYYYLDDNYPLMAESGETPSFYLADNLKKTLKSFRGVLLSTPCLVEYFKKNNIYDTPVLFPLIYREEIKSYPIVTQKDLFTFSYMAGCKLRGNQFCQIILPILNKLSTNHKLRLICPEPLQRLFKIPLNFELIGVPFYEDYETFIQAYGKYAPQALIHINPTYQNTAYKTLNALTNAVLTGSILVVNNELPYTTIPQGAAILVGNTDNIRNNWFNALSKVLHNNNLYKIHENALKYCVMNYSGIQNKNVIKDILNMRNGSASDACIVSMPVRFLFINKIYFDFLRIIIILRKNGINELIKKIKTHVFK